MRNYIILNGNNSNTISGLLIQSLPPISKPLMRTAIEEIDGRDGDIVTNLGYSAYDKEVSIGLYGTYDVDEVIKYFNDNSKGQVTFSNEPDKYYNYEIINQIDFERLIRFKTAIVTLHCQPFKYPTDETPVEIEIQNINNEAEEMDLDNTADAPMTLALKGNTSQANEPTPTTPQPINVVTGRQELEICGKNLIDLSNMLIAGGWTDTTFIPTSSNYITLQYIRVRPSTKYTLSTNLSSTKYSTIRVVDFNSNKNIIRRNAGINLSTSNTFTTNNDTYYIAICFYTSQTATTSDLTQAQLELGETASTYEAYTSYTQEINLGKNLFDKNNTNSINAYINANTMEFSLSSTVKTYYIKCEPNVTYTIQKTSGAQFRVGTSADIPIVDGTLLQGWNDNSVTQYTLTTNANAKYLCICVYNSSSDTKTEQEILDSVQIEKGSQASSYSAYFTPIELCKIGDYQDYLLYNTPNSPYYNNELQDYKWFLHKEIGKYVYNNDMTLNGQDTNTIQFLTPVLNITASLSSLSQKALCNLMTTSVINYCGIGGTTSNKKIRVNIAKSITPTQSDATTLFTNKNLTIYFGLATSTDTEITDTNLINQLNNLANAKSYDPITHITQNANDKPFILNATAVQKGTDTATVDNDGNIYSKPTLDIEGNGIVAIYLNGNQMFSVDLSNSNECIIDVTNLEAYDPETNDLMNRQVTGDYSKFILPVGENQVKVSGNVTKATISNFVRWL